MGTTLSSSVYMDCPIVLGDSSVLGQGVAPSPAGKRLSLTPKAAVVVDDPAAYGGVGPVRAYRVASVNLDPGGDGFICRYILSLQ
jgi:hypothetical protein